MKPMRLSLNCYVISENSVAVNTILAIIRNSTWILLTFLCSILLLNAAKMMNFSLFMSVISDVVIILIILTSVDRDIAFCKLMVILTVIIFSLYNAIFANSYDKLIIENIHIHNSSLDEKNKDIMKIVKRKYIVAIIISIMIYTICFILEHLFNNLLTRFLFQIGVIQVVCTMNNRICIPILYRMTSI